MKYQITLDEIQLRVLMDALDMYSRMGAGQLQVAVEEFLRMHFYELYYNNPLPKGHSAESRFHTRGQWVAHLIYDIKETVFGHSPHGSWGIFNKKVPLTCREAYDLTQVLRRSYAEARIRREKAWGNEQTARHLEVTVDMRDYMPSNPDYPPAQCAAQVDEQYVWEVYRNHPRHGELLRAAGLAGPEDMEEAKASNFVVSEESEEDGGPILLKDHVLHTMAVLASALK